MRYLIGFFLFLGLFGAPVFSQDAKVIKLDVKEASQAKQLYQNLQSAQKEWDAFQNSIKETHLVVPESDPDKGYLVVSGIFTEQNVVCTAGDKVKTVVKCAAGIEEEEKPEYKYTRRGWENGFSFSEDFLYIVPKAQEGAVGNSTCSPASGGRLSCTTPTFLYNSSGTGYTPYAIISGDGVSTVAN